MFGIRKPVCTNPFPRNLFLELIISVEKGEGRKKNYWWLLDQTCCSDSIKFPKFNLNRCCLARGVKKCCQLLIFPWVSLFFFLSDKSSKSHTLIHYPNYSHRPITGASGVSHSAVCNLTDEHVMKFQDSNSQLKKVKGLCLEVFLEAIYCKHNVKNIKICILLCQHQ